MPGLINSEFMMFFEDFQRLFWGIPGFPVRLLIAQI
jgi:hypothetical protein